MPDTINEVGSYADVIFPHETTFVTGGLVRLYGAIGSQVFGINYYRNDDGGEWLGQALLWDLQGKFGGIGQSYPEMDLMPPPGKAMAEYRAINNQIAEAQARLNANPESPPEWRALDERNIKGWRTKAKRLGVVLGISPEAEAA